MSNPNPHVVFIHLDLGIGGAESLVINLAKANLRRDHGADGQKADKSSDKSADTPSPSGSISIYTTHCSPTHCYDEVKPPAGPLSSYVHVRGSWIPRKFYFGGTALCSALRMLYLTYRAMKENPRANAFVIDVLPTGVPYLAEYCNVNAGVLFYCHFPDKLLTRDSVNGETEVDDGKGSTIFLQRLDQLKRIYRWVLDTTEEWTMSYSDLIVVNSKFTRGEVEKVFPSLFLPQNNSANIENTTNSGINGERVKVLYPAIESSLSKERKASIGNSNRADREKTEYKMSGPIVSLNRFERKKNVALLLHAYDLLLERTSKGDTTANLPPLIIAGGYDPLNVENVEHLSELRVLADEILDRYNLPRSTVCSPSRSSTSTDDDALEVQDSSGRPNPHLQNASIAFHPSISNAKRTQLLSSASVWCYTPHREHFGIVPLEAMNAGVPLVAIRSGGPMETIVDGVTGYLVDYSAGDAMSASPRENPTVKGFANAIFKLLSSPSRSKVMGQRGRERVDQAFGMETFRKQWWELIREAQKRGYERHRRRYTSYPNLTWSLVRSFGEMIWVVLFAMLVTWFTWSLKRLELW
ncbi:hypothetical protein ACHAXR_009036 [Thalassiosira sp. AJA248-18]